MGQFARIMHTANALYEKIDVDTATDADYAKFGVYLAANWKPLMDSVFELAAHIDEQQALIAALKDV